MALELPRVTPLGWAVKGENPLPGLIEFVRWSALGAGHGARICGQRVRWLELGCLGPDGKQQQVTNGMALSARTGDLSQGRAAPAARARTFLGLPDATFWNEDSARVDLWPTPGFPAGAFLRGPGPAVSLLARRRPPGRRSRTGTLCS